MGQSSTRRSFMLRARPRTTPASVSWRCMNQKRQCLTLWNEARIGVDSETPTVNLFATTQANVHDIISAIFAPRLGDARLGT